MFEYTKITANSSAHADIPSLNRSYICIQLMRQMLQNESIQPLPELTLDVDKGITPDICVYPKTALRPNFFEDVLRVKDMPLLAVEVIASGQSIQNLLEKSKQLVKAGVQTVWIVEPYGHSIFVIDKKGKHLFHEDVVESQGVKVDFAKVFAV